MQEKSNSKSHDFPRKTVCMWNSRFPDRSFEKHLFPALRPQWNLLSRPRQAGNRWIPMNLYFAIWNACWVFTILLKSAERCSLQHISRETVLRGINLLCLCVTSNRCHPGKRNFSARARDCRRSFLVLRINDVRGFRKKTKELTSLFWPSFRGRLHGN